MLIHYVSEHETVSLIHRCSSDDEVELYKQVKTEKKGPTFTAEDGVESIGFGWFQIRLYVICGLFTVSSCLFMSVSLGKNAEVQQQCSH